MSGLQIALKPTKNMLGSSRFFAQNSHQMLASLWGKVEWVDLQLGVAKIGWFREARVSCMVGRRRKTKQSGEERGQRKESVFGGGRGRWRRKGVAQASLQVCPFLLSFINFGPTCSGIGVASLIYIPNSKPKCKNDLSLITRARTNLRSIQ